MTDKPTAPKPRTAGRPVDANTAAALKTAALNLVREQGFEKVSISAIVAAAGVARQTLYNRWNTKADLVLDAFFDAAGVHAAKPVVTAGQTCRDQLCDFLVRIFDHLSRDGAALRAMIAAAQRDPAFRDAFRDRFVLPREVMLTDILRRAVQTGELSPDRDPDMISAFVHGAFWYRLLNGQPVDTALAEAISDEVFK